MRLLRAIQKIIDSALAPTRFHAAYRYRVVAMVGDRVSAQPIDLSLGLPDLNHIGMRSASGNHAVLTPGTTVLVMFADGNPSYPFVTHFEGKDGSGWLPVSVAIDASSSITIGHTSMNACDVRASHITIKGVNNLHDTVELGCSTTQRTVVCSGDTVSIVGLGTGKISITDEVGSIRKVTA